MRRSAGDASLDPPHSDASVDCRSMICYSGLRFCQIGLLLRERVVLHPRIISTSGGRCVSVITTTSK